MTRRINIGRPPSRSRSNATQAEARPALPPETAATIEDVFPATRRPSVRDTPDQTILTDILNRARGTVRDARDMDYVHVSDLIHKCMRAVALQEELQRPPPVQNLRLADLFTFRQGEALAEVLVNAVRDNAPEQVFGNWRCVCGNHNTDDPCTYAQATSLGACEQCGGLADQYVEVRIQNEEYRIVGRPDLMLINVDGVIHITEIKSITPNEFPDLAYAKPEHVLQAIMYWWLLTQAGYTVSDIVSVLYINKGHSFRGEPHREFVVNAPANVPRIDDMLAEAARLRDYRHNDGPLPERTKCHTAEDTDAKRCYLCQACFSTQGPRIRRRSVDLSAFADDGSTPAPAEDAPRSAPGIVRPSRIPGAKAIPVTGRRSVAVVNRSRVPPRRR